MLTLIPAYLHWHYSRALREIADISHNFIHFLWNFFSIGLLVRTLFYSWKRDTIDKNNAQDTTWYERLIFNIVLRLVGALIRTIFIAAGFISLVILYSGLVVVYAVWILLPILYVVIIVLGGALLIKAI